MSLLKYGLCIILLFLQISLQAQSSLKGMVKAGGVGVGQATISLNKVHGTTDSTGQFYFSSLTPGKYNLHVSLVGHETHHQVIWLGENQTKEILIEMQAFASSLDAVVVSGTMKPVRKLDSPIPVEVYTPQFFKKNPSPSIFESLQNVNGVRPQLNCSVCNTGDIHINGLEGPYTMVTIDGMPIVSSLSSVYGLFGIPSELIERVEIVKGPASGLYGSEAIGGLINIITKSPEKAPLFSASLMTTSWQEHTVDLGLKWKVGKLQSLLGVNGFYYNKIFDKNEDLFTDVTLQKRISVFNKWSLQRKDNRIATLAGRYFYEDRWGGDVRWTKKFRGTDSLYGESIYTTRGELIGNYQLPLREKIFFSFSGTAHHQDSYYGITPYLADQRILFGQLVWEMSQYRNHHLLLGASGRSNYYDDNSTATVDTLTSQNKPENYFLPGIFIQDEWQINSKHSMLAGLRYDHHPVHGNIFTPRLAYKFKLNEKQVLRVNAGTGFRVVNLFTEDHAALTGARTVEIKEKLKPEKSYNVNVNYVSKFGTASRSFVLDASFWYSHFTNQILADYNTDPAKIIYDNLNGYSISKGITLNFESSIMHRLKSMMGITLLDVSKIENRDNKKYKQRPLLTESWSGTWSISYSLPQQGLSFDYTGNIYGPMDLPLASDHDPRKKSSPVWSIQNIQATKWVSKDLELYIGVKNLLNWTPAKNNPFLIARTNDPFDKELDYNGDGTVDTDSNGKVLVTPQNPYGLTFDPSYIYAPNQGIRFFLGLRFKIR